MHTGIDIFCGTKRNQKKCSHANILKSIGKKCIGKRGLYIFVGVLCDVSTHNSVCESIKTFDFVLVNIDTDIYR